MYSGAARAVGYFAGRTKRIVLGRGRRLAVATTDPRRRGDRAVGQLYGGRLSVRLWPWRRERRIRGVRIPMERSAHALAEGRLQLIRKALRERNSSGRENSKRSEELDPDAPDLASESALRLLGQPPGNSAERIMRSSGSESSFRFMQHEWAKAAESIVQLRDIAPEASGPPPRRSR